MTDEPADPPVPLPLDSPFQAFPGALEPSPAPATPAPAASVAARALPNALLQTVPEPLSLPLSVALATVDTWFSIAVPGSAIASPPGNYNTLHSMMAELKNQLSIAASHQI